MSWTEIPSPAESDLAIHRPEGGLHGYQHAIPQHHRYWQNRYVQAQKRVDPALNDMARALLGTLDFYHREWIPMQLLGAPAERTERTRQVLLNAFALSQLLRHILQPTTDLDDAIGHQTASFVTDIYCPDDGLPEDFRTHMKLLQIDEESGTAMPATDPTDTWMRNSAGLYLHDVAPAMPTEFTIGYLAQRGVTADFSQFHTFYPYLSSRL